MACDCTLEDKSSAWSSFLLWSLKCFEAHAVEELFDTETENLSEI